MKKSLLFFVPILVLTLSACNPAQQETIAIKGALEETIEVKTEYVEKGVTYPEDKYNLVTTGTVDTNHLGRYELVYSLYTSEGELYKELHRFVNVVDTTAPTFVEATTNGFYAGITYELSDFVASYSDNYDANYTITVSENTFLYTAPGEYNVSISFTDSSNNVANFNKTITVELDAVKLLEYVYRNQPTKITTTTSGTVGTYTRVQIDTNRSFIYYHGSTMHYLQNVSTSLGTRASIQISAEYGAFNNANIDYHISGSGSAYSTGFANINALQDSVTVSSFRSTINNLNLDVNAMLSELNANLPAVLADFHSYFENTLHLELK